MMKGISVGRMGLNRRILGIEHMAQRPLLLAALFEAKFVSLLHEKGRIKLILKINVKLSEIEIVW